jgi:hypothetical protein
MVFGKKGFQINQSHQEFFVSQNRFVLPKMVAEGFFMDQLCLELSNPFFIENGHLKVLIHCSFRLKLVVRLDLLQRVKMGLQALQIIKLIPCFQKWEQTFD